jgi:membrane associated rhomboid family serine protease
MKKKKRSPEKPAIKMAENHFLYSMAPAGIAAFLMILILFLEWAGDFSLAAFGLRPRELRGIPGILFFPFLHANALHLASNLFPFVLLSTLVYNTLREIFWKVWTFTFLLSGIWTWCFARPGIVIGASAWVYALLGLFLVAGFLRMGRKIMVIAGGLAFLYGGMVYGLLPIKAEISWEGHLMGLLSGCLAAWYWRKEIKEHHKSPEPALPEPEAPYPYWMYAAPHFIDARRNVIPPEDLVWENGQPRIKTEEEKQEIHMEPENQKPQSVPSFRQGPWTITIG